MDVTSPRSPTISRAIAAYVLSDVTTLTLSAGTGGRGVIPDITSAAKSVSMSVRLVFVRSDRPDRLQGELVRDGRARRLAPHVLRPQLHPLALPQRERWNHLSGDQAGDGVFHIVIVDADDPPLVELVGAVHVPAHVRLAAHAGTVLLESVELASESEVAIQRPLRRPPR